MFDHPLEYTADAPQLNLMIEERVQADADRSRRRKKKDSPLAFNHLRCDRLAIRVLLRGTLDRNPGARAAKVRSLY